MVFGSLDGGEDGEHNGLGFVGISKILVMHEDIVVGRKTFNRVELYESLHNGMVMHVDGLGTLSTHIFSLEIFNTMCRIFYTSHSCLTPWQQSLYFLLVSIAAVGYPK